MRPGLFVLDSRVDAKKRLDKVTYRAYRVNMSNENDNYEYYDMIRSYWLEQARRHAVAIDTMIMKDYEPKETFTTEIINPDLAFTDADEIRAHSWGVAL
jgi:hypothetical protein